MGGMGGGARRAMPPPQAQRQEAVRPGPNISIGVGPMVAPPMYGSPFLRPPMGFLGPPLIIPGPSFGPSPTDRALQDQQQRCEHFRISSNAMSASRTLGPSPTDRALQDQQQRCEHF